jgi:predicted methyltransferase
MFPVRRGARRKWIVAFSAILLAVGAYIGWPYVFADEAKESADLIALLALQPGMTAAEIGAGDGAMTVRVARHLGPQGRFFSTEIDDKKQQAIRAAVSKAGLTNVEVVAAGEEKTNLLPLCCDAVFLRKVYHHFGNPAAMNKSLFETLRPGGRLAVIDFEPTLWMGGEPRGVPQNRGGHGMPLELLVRELTAAGFEQDRQVRNWSGRNYCIVFRKPSARSAE